MGQILAVTTEAAIKTTAFNDPRRTQCQGASGTTPAITNRGPFDKRRASRNEVIRSEYAWP